jgi:hypothetical protein
LLRLFLFGSFRSGLEGLLRCAWRVTGADLRCYAGCYTVIHSRKSLVRRLRRAGCQERRFRRVSPSGSFGDGRMIWLSCLATAA